MLFHRRGAEGAEERFIIVFPLRPLRLCGESFRQSESVTLPSASIVAHARSPRQHCMFTATGSWLMCVWAHSMLTAIAVVTPPRPCGPMPVWLIRSSSSFSKAETCESGLLVPTLRKQLASFAIAAALSLVPPKPIPTITGGQGLAPD